MDVRQNIEDGKYKNSVELKAHVRMPVELGKSASMLSDAQIANLPKIKAAYEADKLDQREASEKYRKRESEIIAQFQRDLEVEHGMVGHPKAGKLFSKAWGHGHSGGFHEIAGSYEDLVELAK